MLGLASQADAQGRWYGGNRNEIARAQGVPPGQLPPPDLCRVWYDNRPNGHQSSSMNCRQAETIAARNRNARVIYGTEAYDGRYGNRYPRTYGNRYPGTWRDDERWRDRDP